jgi:hypothetical protein
MNYDEFIKWISEPINGKCNFNTETARLALFCYELSLKVNTLEKENQKLNDSLVHIEDHFARELYEMKQFVKRNVEPDLRYMG